MLANKTNIFNKKLLTIFKMKERIDNILEFLGENPVDFAKSVDVTKELIYMIQQGKRNISKKLANEIQDIFGIPFAYSYKGEGELYSDFSLIKKDKEKIKGKTQSTEAMVPSLNNDKKGVPYYDIDFVGGFDVMENNQTIQPTYYIDFLPFNDADCWLNVTGKSMGPLIAHGDIVALKEVKDWKTFLLEGEIYAIVTFNGFRTIKIIGRDVENLNNYMLIPYNKNGDYHPQPIPKEVITKVFRVKGAIKKFF